MSDEPIVIVMDNLNKEKLKKGCDKVIDALSEFDNIHKIGILHFCIEAFPLPFAIIEKQREIQDGLN